MNKTLQSPAATAEMTAECGTTWLLQYSVATYKRPSGAVLFGVRVDKLEQNGRLTESMETGIITDNHSRALEAIEYVAKGTVPPCTLVEIVDDWLYTTGSFKTA